MEPLALYLHWPFCASKCPYCDFNSHVRDSIDQTRWRDALRRELAREALNVFFQVRGVQELKKKPATSELLDWLKLLMIEDLPPEVLRSSDPKTAIPPLYGALLKNEQDVHLFERLAFLSRRPQR